MKENYYVIRNSDGDTTVRELSRERILKEIKDGEHINSMSDIPFNADTNYWGDGELIIKGTIVKPRAEQVVTKYELE